MRPMKGEKKGEIRHGPSEGKKRETCEKFGEGGAGRGRKRSLFWPPKKKGK